MSLGNFAQVGWTGKVVLSFCVRCLSIIADSGMIIFTCDNSTSDNGRKSRFSDQDRNKAVEMGKGFSIGSFFAEIFLMIVNRSICSRKMLDEQK